MSSLKAAEWFLEKQFPECNAAILAGSAAKGIETSDSDLDLVILDDSRSYPFRKTYTAHGWVIEAFVVTRDSFPMFIEAAAESGLPSILRMCIEGAVLRDDGSAEELIGLARDALQAGPYEWTAQQLSDARYDITNGLLDLQSSRDRAERLFIAGKLIGSVHEFVLRANRQWIGDGKWALRMLRRFDEELSNSLVAALEQLYCNDEHEPVIQLLHEVLRPYGGLLTEGYSEGCWEEE
ncbi:nucleotidyltransferase domain-containing protein [Paenibacillus silviterrae]|uniref:nucleotidyltransferase domain-containing protein n=1 Tax=Paenibacillus silviterrae TaxID=3242194 RepID=UPI002543E50E|nr:nucleotidyltransferase domain-containing protein [Paenibacillus chinjuensis]